MPIRADRVTFGPWRGGGDYSRPAIDLEVDQLFEMQNMEIGLYGEVAKRNGTAKLNASDLNSAATCTGLGKQRFSASSSATWGFFGNKFYENLGGTPADRSGSATITAGDDKTWVAANCGGTLLSCNGNGNDPALSWAASGGNQATADVDSRFTSAGATAWFDNRAWFGDLSSGEDRVWYSSQTDITTWGANDFYQFDERVVALVAMKSFLAVLTENAIWGLFPTNNTDQPYSRQRRADRGTVARRSVVVSEVGLMYFIREEGIYRWDGANQPEKISHALDGERYWDTVRKSRLSESHAIYVPHKRQVQFAIPYGVAQTDMNHVMVWNEQLGSWAGPHNGFTRNASAYFDNKLYYGGYDDGFAWQHDTGTADNATAINAYFHTGATPPLSAADSVRWLYARHQFNPENENLNVLVQQRGPGIPSRVNEFDVGDPTDALVTEFVIGSSVIRGSDWGSFIDTDLYGYDPFTQLKYLNANASEPFTIRRVDLMFKPIGKETLYTTGGV